MNLTGHVAWEVLPGENSEEEGQLNLGVRLFCISLEVQLLSILIILNIPSMAVSFSGCYLTVESIMRYDPSHTKTYLPCSLGLLSAVPPMPHALSDSCMTLWFITNVHHITIHCKSTVCCLT